MTSIPDTKIFLLADDDADDRELFCEAIASLSRNVVSHCAENGKEALEKLAELTELPHIIFLDINMPVMDGWECLREIKTNEQYKHIPVIMYSTSSMQGDINRALNLGACCFLVKPNDYYELQHVLASIADNIGNELPAALNNLSRH